MRDFEICDIFEMKMGIQSTNENKENGGFEVFFPNYELLVIVVSIFELTIYKLDGLILDLGVSKYEFVLCDFEIYHIGMKIGI